MVVWMLWFSEMRSRAKNKIGIPCNIIFSTAWNSERVHARHFDYSLLFVSDTVARYFSHIFAFLMTLCVCVCVFMDERRFIYDAFLVAYFFSLSHFIAVCTMHIMKYVLYIFIIYSLVGGAECLLHLFVYCIVSTVLCCTLRCTVCLDYFWLCLGLLCHQSGWYWVWMVANQFRNC